MYGLDLFSGIGGITKALGKWVTPIAYCEKDKYVRTVLLSRMREREIPSAPIWDDIRTLKGSHIPQLVDIVYGGFPCQDISTAGRGAGLGGKRSGLYWELHRIVDECRPAFVFLENVPGIRTKGLRQVVGSLADIGYDCRWTRISAAEVGAHHIRQRWFLLAHANGKRVRDQQGRWERSQWANTSEPFDNGAQGYVANTEGRRFEPMRDDVNAPLQRTNGPEESNNGSGQNYMADSESIGWTERRAEFGSRKRESIAAAGSIENNPRCWPTEPDVGRVANGVPFRVDRIKSLGNAVVPEQAKAAFERLIGYG